MQRELGTNRIGRRRREPADRAVQPSNKATIEPALGALPSATQRGQLYHPRGDFTLIDPPRLGFSDKHPS